MHSLLPHQHQDELGDDEEYAQADGLIDYLQLIFHTDLGDGHLDNFENGRGFDFEIAVNLYSDLEFHSYYPLSQQPTVHQPRTIFYDHDIPILKKDVIVHLDFRGPPALV